MNCYFIAWLNIYDSIAAIFTFYCLFAVNYEGYLDILVELAMHASGSFTVERCFNAGSLSLWEAIASELLAVRTELSKTKQGPHLLRKLDINR